MGLSLAKYVKNFMCIGFSRAALLKTITVLITRKQDLLHGVLQCLMYLLIGLIFTIQYSRCVCESTMTASVPLIRLVACAPTQSSHSLNRLAKYGRLPLRLESHRSFGEVQYVESVGYIMQYILPWYSSFLTFTTLSSLFPSKT